MTGGSLPAQTWHDIMAYAHQGIELKPIPGLERSRRPWRESRTGVQERERRSAERPASDPQAGPTSWCGSSG